METKFLILFLNFARDKAICPLLPSFSNSRLVPGGYATPAKSVEHDYGTL
jgi:hypothetical protein